MDKTGKSTVVQLKRASPQLKDESKAGSPPPKAGNDQVPDKSHVRADPVRAPRDHPLHLEANSRQLDTSMAEIPDLALAQIGTAEESTETAAPHTVAEFEAAMCALGQSMGLPFADMLDYLDIVLVMAGQNIEDHYETLDKWDTLTPENIAIFYDEAKRSAFTASDEQVFIFCLYRAQGCSAEEAGQNCRFGPYYLGLGADKRGEYMESVRKKGFSGCPLTFPRIDATVDEKTFEVLGSGLSNSVYKIEVSGRAYAWKPYNPTVLPSGGAAHSGITEKGYYPMESHMFALTIAKAMAGFDDSRCVVGEALPAIINDKPGLLMDIAPGSNRRLGTHVYREEIARDSAQYRSCMRAKESFKNPHIYNTQCKIMRATAITFEGVDGKDLYITGPRTLDGSTNHVKTEMFENPGFLEDQFDVDLVCDLIGHTDKHVGNIFYNGSKFTLIDLDDTFGIDKYEDIVKEEDASGKHFLLFLTAPVKYVSARSAECLQSAGFSKVVDAAIADLETISYPAARITACVDRILDRKAGIEAKEIEVIKNPEDWLKIDISDPTASLAGRTKMSAI
jgi:hypothetical protein